MHVFEHILEVSGLFRFNNYPLDEKAYSVMLYAAGLSLRDVSERYCITMASWGRVLGGGSTSSQRCSL